MVFTDCVDEREGDIDAVVEPELDVDKVAVAEVDRMRESEMLI